MLKKLGFRMAVRRRELTLAGVFAVTALIGSLPLPACAAGSVESAFDTIKGMAGEWTGKDDDGQPAVCTYEVSSGGTIVIEKLTPGNHPCMTTVYHRDKDSLMMTHYCNMNNQPRMRLKNFDADKRSLKFDFVDITNLQNEKDGYIRDLNISMPDKQHLEQDWTFLKDGKEAHALFHFERKTGDGKSNSIDSSTRSGSASNGAPEGTTADCCEPKKK